VTAILQEMMTCGNWEDYVSLVSDPTNGHRILNNSFRHQGVE